MPLPQFPPIGDAQFRYGVRDVVLDGIDADAAAFRDLTARHAMLHGVYGAPFRGRQHIIMRRSSAARSLSHGRSYSHAGAFSLPSQIGRR